MTHTTEQHTKFKLCTRQKSNVYPPVLSKPDITESQVVLKSDTSSSNYNRETPHSNSSTNNRWHL